MLSDSFVQIILSKEYLRLKFHFPFYPYNEGRSLKNLYVTKIQNIFFPTKYTSIFVLLYFSE